MNRTEHLLTVLAEEAVEVAQRADKALRFGLSEKQPGQQLTNFERMQRELWDFEAAFEMLAEHIGAPELLLQSPARRAALDAKKAKVEHFLAYSRQLGTLQD